MTPKTILGFQFGSAAAIRAAAASRATMPVALVMVLCTSVARNYDQTWILENSVLWLFGGMLVSLVSGTWLYVVLRHKFFDAPTARNEWAPWMALFWLTAPTGWLYAIPVERFLSRTDAAVANAIFLGIVALWRVLLITRVVSVLRSAPFKMVLPWVLFGALVETFALTVVFGGFARRILAGMMGMRNAPEEDIVIAVTDSALTLSMFALIPMFIVAKLVTRGRTFQGSPAFPQRERGKVPLGFLSGCVVAWAAIAVVPQTETQRNFKLENLASEKRFAEAVQFMSAHEPGDFCQAKRLPPNPFEMSVYSQLPGFFEQFDGSEAPWVREHCLDALGDLLDSSTDEWAVRRVTSRIDYESEGWVRGLRVVAGNTACRDWMALHGERVKGLWKSVRFERDSQMPQETRRELSQLFVKLGVPRPAESEAKPDQ